MRPNADEVLRGVQASLLANVLPEVQTEYTRTQVMIIYALLGIVGVQWDSGPQRALEDNASLRELADRAAEEVANGRFAQELRSLAAEEPSLRLSEIAAANATLAAALARVAAEEPELIALRSEIIDWLRADAESRSYALMGPRADG
jgi:hypothetical protein